MGTSDSVQWIAQRISAALRLAKRVTGVRAARLLGCRRSAQVYACGCRHELSSARDTSTQHDEVRVLDFCDLTASPRLGPYLHAIAVSPLRSQDHDVNARGPRHFCERSGSTVAGTLLNSCKRPALLCVPDDYCSKKSPRSLLSSLLSVVRI